MKTKFISAALLAALALLSSSCVTQKKYSQLQDDYDLLMSQFNDAKIALASCETGSKSLEERLAEARANNAKLLEQYQALQASLDKSINQSGTNISKLVDEINASNKYIKQLTDAKSKSARPVKHSARLPKSSPTTRTMRYLLKVTPTTFPSTARTSATTGTSPASAPPASYRLYRTSMASIQAD